VAAADPDAAEMAEFGLNDEQRKRLISRSAVARRVIVAAMQSRRTILMVAAIILATLVVAWLFYSIPEEGLVSRHPWR
jgi:hypothetical protein